MTKTFEAVFFDMDGTFVNSEPHWLAAETELMAEYGHAWTHEDQQYCLGGPLDKVGRYMASLSGEQKSPEFFRDELVKRTIEHFQSDIEYMPGALELLLELKSEGVALGLVTASPEPMMRATLGRLDENLFDVAISGDDVAVTKPSPEAYLLAANTLGVNIENCIVLEDSNTGISAAKASGAFVIAIPMFISVSPEDRLVVLDSLSGISAKDLEELYSRDLTEERI